MRGNSGGGKAVSVMASIPLSQAVDGFDLSLRARGLSVHTIGDYRRTLNLFRQHMPHNPMVADITKADVEDFLSVQMARRLPNGKTLTNKSLRNYYIGLSAFWTWCLEEKIVRGQIVRKIKKPRPEVRTIQPFTEPEIRLLLSSVRKSGAYRSGGVMDGALVQMSLPMASRNIAIIMLLLDTGLRASELCHARVGDVDLRGGHITVMGKGKKERRVPFGARTGKAIWRYLSTRDGRLPTDPLFLSRSGLELRRTDLASTLVQAGKRVGIDNTNPHRFRHTFAIYYLRNGGDIYTLQKILGHSSLEMVRRYLALAQVDLENAHRRASPVENMKL